MADVLEKPTIVWTGSVELGCGIRRDARVVLDTFSRKDCMPEPWPIVEVRGVDAAGGVRWSSIPTKDMPEQTTQLREAVLGLAMRELFCRQGSGR